MMRKISFGLCLTFVLLFSTSVLASCIESDGGKNYYVKGMVYSSKTNRYYIDECLDEVRLKESYCDGDPYYIVIRCSNSLCTNGVCSEEVGEIEHEENERWSEMEGTLCNGCFHDFECLSYGTRITLNETPSFCGTSRSLESQKDNWERCSNDYECKTNYCSFRRCRGESWFDDFWGWLRGIFDWW